MPWISQVSHNGPTVPKKKIYVYAVPGTQVNPIVLVRFDLHFARLLLHSTTIGFKSSLRQNPSARSDIIPSLHVEFKGHFRQIRPS